MDSFDYAFIKTLGAEGGCSDDPDDRGGRTNYGITETVFKDALNRLVISGVTDIKNLTVAQAKAIYRIDYWLSIKLDQVLNIDIAGEIFDTAVNMGRSRAVKIVQESLNFLGEKMVVDGIMGAATLAAINKWIQRDVRALFVCLNGYQFMKYVDIVKSNPGQVKFARGWTKRIQAYKEA
jgi:lysozyme family protein